MLAGILVLCGLVFFVACLEGEYMEAVYFVFGVLLLLAFLWLFL